MKKTLSRPATKRCFRLESLEQRDLLTADILGWLPDYTAPGDQLVIRQGSDDNDFYVTRVDLSDIDVTPLLENRSFNADSSSLDVFADWSVTNEPSSFGTVFSIDAIDAIDAATSSDSSLVRLASDAWMSTTRDYLLTGATLYSTIDIAANQDSAVEQVENPNAVVANVALDQFAAGQGNVAVISTSVDISVLGDGPTPSVSLNVADNLDASLWVHTDSNMVGFTTSSSSVTDFAVGELVVIETIVRFGGGTDALDASPLDSIHDETDRFEIEIAPSRPTSGEGSPGITDPVFDVEPIRATPKAPKSASSLASVVATIDIDQNQLLAQPVQASQSVSNRVASADLQICSMDSPEIDPDVGTVVFRVEPIMARHHRIEFEQHVTATAKLDVFPNTDRSAPEVSEFKLTSSNIDADLPRIEQMVAIVAAGEFELGEVTFASQDTAVDNQDPPVPVANVSETPIASDQGQVRHRWQTAVDILMASVGGAMIYGGRDSSRYNQYQIRR